MWSVVVVWAGSLPPSFLHPGRAGGDSLMMRKMETGDKGNGGMKMVVVGMGTMWGGTWGWWQHRWAPLEPSGPPHCLSACQLGPSSTLKTCTSPFVVSGQPWEPVSTLPFPCLICQIVYPLLPSQCDAQGGFRLRGDGGGSILEQGVTCPPIRSREAAL